MARPTGLDFLVDKSDWTRRRFDDVTPPALAEGQVRFRVDRFAFTANNISYAVAGDALGYWRFFPAPEGWGRLPVMGFADVVESKHDAVAIDTRCFGFYPMSRELVIEPGAEGTAGIVDAAPHREGIAPVYNTYTPTEGDVLYEAAHEDELMLMRGLFLTSFLADDFVADRGFGERAVLISSASSKTSIALGHRVAARGAARAVGLTSARNRDFVLALGCYDEVVTYDEIEAIDADRPSVYVDMAGSAPVRRAVHEHLGYRRSQRSLGARGRLADPVPFTHHVPRREYRERPAGRTVVPDGTGAVDGRVRRGAGPAWDPLGQHHRGES